jgi:hypothetical protein
MIQHRLADLVLVAHALFVAFVVGGLVAVVLCAALDWRWVRDFRFRLSHLVAIGCVVLQSWLGFLCPLTAWEMQLREQGGEATYRDTFIAHWLHELLFFAAPVWVFALIYTLFFGAVVSAWFLVRPRRSRG